MSWPPRADWKEAGERGELPQDVQLCGGEVAGGDLQHQLVHILVCPMPQAVCRHLAERFNKAPEVLRAL